MAEETKLKTQQAHDIVNKEINVILKKIEYWKGRKDNIAFSTWAEIIRDDFNYLRGIISQEATEIEFLEPHFIGRSWEDRLQALKISMADLQEKVK